MGRFRIDKGTSLRGDNDQRVRHMLARAPADRSWRRRGWLVLARSCPAKVQLTQDSGGGSSSGSSAKIAKATRGGSGGGSSDGTAHVARVVQSTSDLVRLVGRVMNVEVKGFFRLVVCFL